MSFRPANLKKFPPTIQDLDPEWARFCLEVERFLTLNLGLELNGKRLLVSISGGADSTALLIVTHYLALKNEAHVEAAHMDHMLRKESGKDAWHVELLCDVLGLHCHTESHDVRGFAEKNRIGLEEAGRDLRYAMLNKIQREQKFDYVFLGHHQDDLAEDVVMRLIRGVGWPGLSGMPAYDAGRRIARPFLMTPKSRLKDFLVALEVAWGEDQTNQDPAYARNRVRNEIIPLLERENPNFLEGIRRLWMQGEMDRRFLDSEIRKIAPEISSDTMVLLGKARIASIEQPALRLRLYKHILDRLGPGQALSETLFKLDVAWFGKRSDAVFQFPGAKTATITRDGILFSRTIPRESDGN